MERDFDIFISYSRKDLSKVKKIKAMIEQSTGARCWMDLKGGIKSGDPRFIKTITDSIDGCIVFIFMRSNYSQKSDYALLELSYAEKETKSHVVIVNIDNSEWIKEFRFLYRYTDSIDWRNQDQREKLLSDIRSWINKRIEDGNKAEARDNSKEKEYTKRKADKEKKSFFKRWFRWNVIYSISIILMLVFTVYYNFKEHTENDDIPSKRELQKETIYNMIGSIEKEFHPELIPRELDSIKEVLFIRKFQYTTLDYCALWKQTDIEDRYTRHSDKNHFEIKKYLKNEFYRDSVLGECGQKLIKSLMDEVSELSRLGKDNLIELEKTKVVLNSFHTKTKIMEDVRKESSRYAERGDLKQALKLYDDAQNLDECVNFDSLYFDYIIYINSVFQMRIRQYASNGAYSMD